nr:hypothetical protein [Tanacetum cinerariifolium]
MSHLDIILTLNLFRVFYVPSYNSRWMSFSKRPRKNTPQCYTKPLDSLKNWNNRFFWVDERIFPTIEEWRINAPKDKMPSADSYFATDVMTLNTHRTPIQKQPEALLCLVGLTRSYFLGDDVALNPTRVKTGTRPRAAYEVPLLTATTSRVIDMEDTTVAIGSSGTPPALEKSPSGKEVAAIGPLVNKRCRKSGNDEAEANAPPKVLRKDHDAVRPAQSTLGGKSLALIGLDSGSTFSTPTIQSAPTAAQSVSDPNPLSYVKPKSHPERDITQSSRKTTTEIPTENVDTIEVQGLFSVKSLELGKLTSFPSMDGSPGDHIVPLGYFSELCHLPNTDFLSQYNINLAQQVEMGSQLRLRFEQEVRLLKKSTAKIARQDQRIQARKEEIKKLNQDIKSLRVMVEQRCAEIDALMDKLNVDFDEELYPHMLTAITGCRWVIGHGMRLAIMKCAKYPKLRQAFANVMSGGLVKAYDPKADNKYVKALQDLKELKYPLVDQLERLKDALIELIMASLQLESDSEEDAP